MKRKKKKNKNYKIIVGKPINIEQFEKYLKRKKKKKQT
jgi:hypothetical protein